MKRTKTVLALIVIGLVQAGSPARAADTTGWGVQEIGDCMRENLFERGSVRDFQIRSVDPEGRSKQVKFKAFWRPVDRGDGARITLQLVEPENLRGTSYLLVRNDNEEELYVYLPALQRVTRVDGGDASRKLWGTDLTLADVRQIQGLLVEGDAKRLADARVADRPVYLLETLTDPEESGYRRVVSHVDQESCILLKAEMFSNDGEPEKVVEADLSTLMNFDPWWVVLGYRVTDNRAGTYTEVALSNLFIEETLPDSLFTPEGFHVDRK